MKLDDLRALLAMCVIKGWEIEQIKLESAFTYAYLDIDQFAEPPEGFIENPGEKLWVSKAMYGLRQSPYLWRKYFYAIMEKMGFIEQSDGVFFRMVSRRPIIIAINVDQILVLSSSSSRIKKTAYILSDYFDLKLVGTPQSFMGIEIEYHKNGINLHCTRLVSELLERTNDIHLGAYFDVPVIQKNCLRSVNYKNKEGGGEESMSEDMSELLNDEERVAFTKAVASLGYITSRCRPDLSFVVLQLRTKTCNPRYVHWRMLRHALQYLNMTWLSVLSYTHPSTSFNRIRGHVCSNFAGADDSEVSYDQAIFLWKASNCTISWSALRIKSRSKTPEILEVKATTAALETGAYLGELMWKTGAMNSNQVVLSTLSKISTNIKSLASKPAYKMTVKKYAAICKKAKVEVSKPAKSLFILPTSAGLSEYEKLRTQLGLLELF